MQRLMRNFILACLMAWLPMQGVASSFMPFCQHQSPLSAQQAMAHEHAAHHHDHQHHSNSNLPCDDCSMCHLCTATPIPTAFERISLNLSEVFTSSERPLIASFIPEQPQRPPLARIA